MKLAGISFGWYYCGNGELKKGGSKSSLTAPVALFETTHSLTMEPILKAAGALRLRTTSHLTELTVKGSQLKTSLDRLLGKPIQDQAQAVGLVHSTELADLTLLRDQILSPFKEALTA